MCETDRLSSRECNVPDCSVARVVISFFESTCGVYMYSGATLAVWTLPLSLASNGTISPGLIICLRCIGAGGITVTASTLDLVEGAATYALATANGACFINEDSYWFIYSKSAIPVPTTLPTNIPSVTPAPQTTTGVTFATTTATVNGASSGAGGTIGASAGPTPTPAPILRKLGGGRRLV
jgi:hypothetical protein